MFNIIDPENRGKVNFGQFSEFVHSVFDLGRQLENDSSNKINANDKIGDNAELRAKQLFQVCFGLWVCHCLCRNDVVKV